MSLNRRHFLKSTAGVTAGFAGLHRFLNTPLKAEIPALEPVYGDLVPDPLHIIDLPKGFSYRILGRTGDVMDDGLRLPGYPDGMATFEGPDGTCIIIRNHELTADTTFLGPFGVQNELLAKYSRDLIYDPGKGSRPHIGGTTTVVYDTHKQEIVRQFLSLVGICRACAGGPTPWNTWITCEESVDRASTGKEGYNERDHGYNFEVPATAEPGLTKPVPLTAMGRFNHEAVAVDPKTSIVYQSEDRPDGLFYRFIPKEPKDLAAGGKLQALAIQGNPSADTRNWQDIKVPFPVGRAFDTTWIDMEIPEAPEDDLRYRGFKAGAARFARNEGMWYGDGTIYVASTNGGEKQLGQIFRYTPSPAEGQPGEAAHPGRVELFLEPNNRDVLQGADNLTIAPWGDVVFCEDGRRTQHVRGIRPDGRGVYNLARNQYNRNEFAGVCFSPDGSTFFVNIQKPGLTLAITGPWDERSVAGV